MIKGVELLENKCCAKPGDWFWRDHATWIGVHKRTNKVLYAVTVWKWRRMTANWSISAFEILVDEADDCLRQVITKCCQWRCTCKVGTRLMNLHKVLFKFRRLCDYCKGTRCREKNHTYLPLVAKFARPNSNCQWELANKQIGGVRKGTPLMRKRQYSTCAFHRFQNWHSGSWMCQ